MKKYVPDYKPAELEAKILVDHDLARIVRGLRLARSERKARTALVDSWSQRIARIALVDLSVSVWIVLVVDQILALGIISLGACPEEAIPQRPAAGWETA